MWGVLKPFHLQKPCWGLPMFEADPSPRLFGLPPGADFAAELVAGLIARTAHLRPDALSRVTVYVNSSRMQRRVRDLFDGHGTRLLPRLRLITDLGRDPISALPPAVSPLRRRLELTQLVSTLLKAQPDFAPSTAAVDLAESLTALMEEMQDEGVDPAALSPALAEDHAAHWDASLRFIGLVSRYFTADAEPDAKARQRQIVLALAERWREAPPVDPVIVAGSTGSRGTTQILMEAVANLPQGAVILPGFDRDMPEIAWNSLDSGPAPQEDHPQYRFLPLCRALKLRPQEVRPWTARPAPDPARNALVSLSLRPAPVTDRWRAEGPALGDLLTATQGMTLVEASTPRAESLALAMILRKAVEDGRRAALISPDRMLTRRVAAALDRWGIVPDDSAGHPLPLTAPGRLLRHVARAFGERLAADGLLVLLKHPLTASGGDRGTHVLLTQKLELRLRARGPAFPAPADLRAWADGKEPARMAWALWLGQVIDLLDQGEQPLSAWIETHIAVTELLASGPDSRTGAAELWNKEPGVKARRAMDALMREADAAPSMTAPEYADLLDSILQSDTVRQSETVHPLISILGTLEARVGGADLVILAGLNEGIWPAPADPDPWLSRQMRLRAGLLLPERQIGLSAHDYQQAAGTPEVVFSRALRDAEAETVPSRWIARLTNLMEGLPAQNGKDALKAMRDRGQDWLRQTRALEQVESTAPAPRPAPRPPVDQRPTVLPVTDIRTLIRDPYAVYAKRILRLRVLDPLQPSPDARLRGTALHKVVEAYLKHPDRLTMSRDDLLALAERVLEETVPWPAARRFWLARMGRLADAFLTAEADRAAGSETSLVEEDGSATLLGGRFTLTARADRIDVLRDGRVHVYDYKSGTPPTPEQQKHFEKQLILEAAIAEAGGFAALGHVDVAAYSYIHLGGSGDTKTTDLGPGQVAEAWAHLERLVDSYFDPQRGYVSRRAVFEDRYPGDYDHLARHGEWAISDAPKPEDME